MERRGLRSGVERVSDFGVERGFRATRRLKGAGCVAYCGMVCSGLLP